MNYQACYQLIFSQLTNQSGLTALWLWRLIFFFNLYFSLHLTGWACNNHVAPRSSLVSVHLSVCSAQCSCSPVSKWAEAARHPVWCDGGGGEQKFSGTLLCLGFLQRLLSQPGYQCDHTESHHHPVRWGQCPAVQLKWFEKKNRHCILFELWFNVLLVTALSPIKWLQQKNSYQCITLLISVALFQICEWTKLEIWHLCTWSLLSGYQYI